MTKSIIQLANEAHLYDDDQEPLVQHLEKFAALHRAAIIEELTGELPEQCNVALVRNFQGQGEYRNLSWEYCETTAKYSEKQMREYAAGLVAKAVAAERDACADLCEQFTHYGE